MGLSRQHVSVAELDPSLMSPGPMRCLPGSRRCKRMLARSVTCFMAPTIGLWSQILPALPSAPRYRRQNRAFTPGAALREHMAWPTARRSITGTAVRAA